MDPAYEALFDVPCPPVPNLAQVSFISHVRSGGRRTLVRLSRCAAMHDSVKYSRPLRPYRRANSDAK
jgi:hypothetical protein